MKFKSLILLMALVCCGDAWGINYIQQTSSGGTHEAYFTSLGDLATAIASCSDGDIIKLLKTADQSVVYTLDSDKTIDLGTAALSTMKSVKIWAPGGYTYKVTSCDTDGSAERVTLPTGITAFEEGLSAVYVYGSGVGGLNHRTKYYIKTYNSSNGETTLTDVPDGMDKVNLTSDNLATRPCYLYLHAEVQLAAPTSQPYAKFLRLLNGGDITMENITFSLNAPQYVGQGGSTYLNGSSSAGICLEIYQPDGDVILNGIQVRNCIAGSSTDGTTSYGINVDSTSRYEVGHTLVHTDSLQMTNCFTDNTDYAGIRFCDVWDVSLSNCACMNFKQRGATDSSHGGYTNGPNVDEITIDDCFLVCENTAATAGDEGTTGTTSRLRSCMNLNSDCSVRNIAITDTILDLRECEGAGMSWDYTYNSTQPLWKVQNAETLTVTDCKFLHGGNEDTTYSNAAHSLKMDPGAGSVNFGNENVVFRRCEFSGAISCAYESQTNTSLAFYGCKIQKYGNFGSSAAIDYVEYEDFTLDDDVNGMVTTTSVVSNLRDQSGYYPIVVRMHNKNWASLPGTPTWTFDDTTIDVNCQYLDARLIHGLSVTAPTKGQVNFDDAGMYCRNNASGKGFVFSSADSSTSIED